MGVGGGPSGLSLGGQELKVLGEGAGGTRKWGLGMGDRPREGGRGKGVSRALRCHELVIGLLRQRVPLQRHLPEGGGDLRTGGTTEAREG